MGLGLARELISPTFCLDLIFHLRSDLKYHSGSFAETVDKAAGSRMPRGWYVRSAESRGSAIAPEMLRTTETPDCDNGPV